MENTDLQQKYQTDEEIKHQQDLYFLSMGLTGQLVVIDMRLVILHHELQLLELEALLLQ